MVGVHGEAEQFLPVTRLCLSSASSGVAMTTFDFSCGVAMATLDLVSFSVAMVIGPAPVTKLGLSLASSGVVITTFDCALAPWGVSWLPWEISRVLVTFCKTCSASLKIPLSY